MSQFDLQTSEGPLRTALDPAATSTRVTLARGDGIGPEIADATLAVLEAAGARLQFDEIAIGEAVYRRGHTAGIEPGAWDTIRTNRVLLKAPITTPQGGGYKSLNVTLRKALNLFANVRPTKAYHPFVPSRHPHMDLVIVRENEEDLYAGIEHRQTDEVTQVLKLITRPGSERIVRYAFEYARAHGRRKVTCMSKDNIMKITDGLFHRVFDEVAAEYPELQAEHQIIDIGAARMAAEPERFDVVVTANLYGDILSDIASQVAGSVGLAGSANLGSGCAMFEAVHGSAPDIAGRDIANPSGLLEAAVLMLVHLGQGDVAQRIQNAWLTTLEDGVHTADVYREGSGARRVGTAEFAAQVVERLGEQPRQLTPARFAAEAPRLPEAQRRQPQRKELLGIDVFVDWHPERRDPLRLGTLLEQATTGAFRLEMITNRGVKVYPNGLPETFCTDHWRCRFLAADDGATSFGRVLELLASLAAKGVDVIKTEHLYAFDGERGFSLGQGE